MEPQFLERAYRLIVSELCGYGSIPCIELGPKLSEWSRVTAVAAAPVQR